MNIQTVNVVFPQGIPAESWLNEDRFELFRRGYGYATTQTSAIGPLSKLIAEEAFDLYEAIARGIAYAKGERYAGTYE